MDRQFFKVPCVCSCVWLPELTRHGGCERDIGERPLVRGQQDTRQDVTSLPTLPCGSSDSRTHRLSCEGKRGPCRVADWLGRPWTSLNWLLQRGDWYIKPFTGYQPYALPRAYGGSTTRNSPTARCLKSAPTWLVASPTPVSESIIGVDINLGILLTSCNVM